MYDVLYLYPELHSKLSMRDQAKYPATSCPSSLTAEEKHLFSNKICPKSKMLGPTLQKFVDIMLQEVDSLQVVDVALLVAEPVFRYEHLVVSKLVVNPVK